MNIVCGYSFDNQASWFIFYSVRPLIHSSDSLRSRSSFHTTPYPMLSARTCLNKCSSLIKIPYNLEITGIQNLLCKHTKLYRIKTKCQTAVITHSNSNYVRRLLSTFFTAKIFYLKKQRCQFSYPAFSYLENAMPLIICRPARALWPARRAATACWSLKHVDRDQTSS